jgi:hypothetical protein
MAAERETVNMPIQGTAADVLKKAMIDVDAALVRYNAGRPAPSRMILTVHDELLFEAPDAEAADVSVLSENASQPMRGGQGRGRRSAVTRTTDDGQFTLNVTAGHVVIVARSIAEESGEAGASWAAAEATPSAGTHVTTNLKLQRSGGLSGTIDLQPRTRTSPATLAGTLVSLEPADADAKAVLLDGPPRVAAAADGHFVMPEVPPGRYRLTAVVAAPWLIDQITANGQQGLDRPIAIPPGAFIRDATITATDVPNELDGSVVDASGHAVAFGLVFAFAADPADRVPARRLQATRTDRDGHFTLTGLPSGDYLVGLSAGADPATWYSPGFLASVARGATPVRVGRGTTHTTVVSGRQ